MLNSHDQRIEFDEHLRVVVTLRGELVERRSLNGRRLRLPREERSEFLVFADRGKILAAGFQPVLELDEVAPVLVAAEPVVDVSVVLRCEVDT